MKIVKQFFFCRYRENGRETVYFSVFANNLEHFLESISIHYNKKYVVISFPFVLIRFFVIPSARHVANMSEQKQGETAIIKQITF